MKKQCIYCEHFILESLRPGAKGFHEISLNKQERMDFPKRHISSFGMVKQTVCKRGLWKHDDILKDQNYFTNHLTMNRKKCHHFEQFTGTASYEDRIKNTKILSDKKDLSTSVAHNRWMIILTFILVLLDLPGKVWDKIFPETTATETTATETTATETTATETTATETTATETTATETTGKSTE